MHDTVYNLTIKSSYLAPELSVYHSRFTEIFRFQVKRRRLVEEDRILAKDNISQKIEVSHKINKEE